MANDKPKNIVKVNDLDFEANPDPVKVPVGGSKTVTFPDLFDMSPDEAEARLTDLEAALQTGRIKKLLDDWLSPDDRVLLDEAFPTYKAQALVLGRVFEAYQATWGSMGEGDASES